MNQVVNDFSKINVIASRKLHVHVCAGLVKFGNAVNSRQFGQNVKSQKILMFCCVSFHNRYPPKWTSEHHCKIYGLHITIFTFIFFYLSS